MQQRRRWALATRIVGTLIAIAALALCFRAIANEWPTVSGAIRDASIGWLAMSLIFSVLSMGWLGVLWQRSLHIFAHPTPLTATISWYFAGELGKYVPGGVWAVLGRGELARRDAGVPRGTAYATTLICYATMCLGAFCFCALLVPWMLLHEELPAALTVTLLVLSILALPLTVLSIHPGIFGRLLALARRVSKGRVDLIAPSWSSMIVLVLWSVPAWAFLGIAAWCVVEAVGFSGALPTVAFASVAAWVIGFLLFPVPAGAGVREVVFVALAGMATGPAAAVAILARVLLMVADGLGGLAGLAIVGRRLRNSAVTQSPDTAEKPGEH